MRHARNIIAGLDIAAGIVCLIAGDYSMAALCFFNITLLY